SAHVRHDGPAEGDQLADGAEDPGPRQPPDDGDLPQLHRRPHPGRVRAEVVRTGSAAVQQTGRLMAGFWSNATRPPTSPRFPRCAQSSTPTLDPGAESGFSSSLEMRWVPVRGRPSNGRE